jgi:hypothetical protein
MNGSTRSYLEEIKRQHEEGTLSPEQATEFIVVTLIDQAINGEKLLNHIKDLNERFDKLDRKLDRSIERQRENPSLLYLLRFDTKKTIAIIIFLFAIVSTWFVSGFRQPILEFLGFPVF